MVRYQCSAEVNGSDIGLGLVNGLLIAIPLWVIIGVAIAVVFDVGPMEETSSVALMIAAVWEAMLLRPYLRTLRTRFRRYVDFRRADTEVGRPDTKRNASRLQASWAKRTPADRDSPHRALENVGGWSFESIEHLLRYVEQKSAVSNEAHPVVAPQALLRQSLALSALVGAYLQYYFLEVNLQIAALHSVTVFAPMVSMT